LDDGPSHLVKSGVMVADVFNRSVDRLVTNGSIGLGELEKIRSLNAHWSSSVFAKYSYAVMTNNVHSVQQNRSKLTKAELALRLLFHDTKSVIKTVQMSWLPPLLSSSDLPDESLESVRPWFMRFALAHARRRFGH
jgi:hypothetical protein